MIKRTFVLIAISVVVCLIAFAEDKTQSVQHLATALDHITVLEFGEPVTQAAAGTASDVTGLHPRGIG
ncbi:MAG TPA: hypothetical protein VKY85_01005 [Candidatus Angelobacter sp.]|nr:hypothetical protein [Candidatus Angelobacter sp.]